MGKGTILASRNLKKKSEISQRGAHNMLTNIKVLFMFIKKIRISASGKETAESWVHSSDNQARQESSVRLHCPHSAAEAKSERASVMCGKTLPLSEEDRLIPDIVTPAHRGMKKEKET